MATTVNWVNLSNGSLAGITDYRDRVTATAVALFFTFVVNYVVQAYTTFVKKDEGKPRAQKKLLETCQVLYWFGIASIFSILPPFYYGAFNAVLSYFTLILVILLHAFCFTETRVKGRSLWSIVYFFYHFAIFLWIIVGLILAYIWARQAATFAA